jgi:hypothetical protein
MRTGEVWLAAVLTSLALTSCTHEHAGSLPTSSPSTPSTSWASSPAATGAAAEAALVHAARNYYSVLEAAGGNPSVGADKVAALIDPHCTCINVVQFLRDQAHAGHRIERQVQVLAPRAVAGSNGGTVFLTLEQRAGRVTDAAGHTLERLAASRDEVVLDFRSARGLLLVTQISVSK